MYSIWVLFGRCYIWDVHIFQVLLMATYNGPQNVAAARA